MKKTEEAHIAGVFDKGGILSVRIEKDQGLRVGHDLYPVVSISHPQNDFDVLMGEMMAYCEDNGVIYTLEELEKETQTTDELTIRRPGDIERFLKPLLPYLVTKYQASLIMLNDLLPLLEEKMHRTKDGFMQCVEIADKIREFSHSSGMVKYDKKYFEENGLQ